MVKELLPKLSLIPLWVGDREHIPAFRTFHILFWLEFPEFS